MCKEDRRIGQEMTYGASVVAVTAGVTTRLLTRRVGRQRVSVAVPMDSFNAGGQQFNVCVFVNNQYVPVSSVNVYGGPVLIFRVEDYGPLLYEEWWTVNTIGIAANVGVVEWYYDKSLRDV